MGAAVCGARALDEPCGAPGTGVYVMAQKKLESVDFQEGAEGRLSIAECRDLLGDEGHALSDEEIDALRQNAETMAHVLIGIFLESRSSKR